MGLGGYMTEQEKELVEIMVKEHDNLTNDPRTRKTAQAILQAGYTKNKGEKVWEGKVIPLRDKITSHEILSPDFYFGKNIEVFIREVKE
jgi:hypothetical protein